MTENLSFKEWVKQNNSLIKELYNVFIDMCHKYNIKVIDDNCSRIDFAYLLFTHTDVKVKLDKENLYHDLFYYN